MDEITLTPEEVVGGLNGSATRHAAACLFSAPSCVSRT